LTGEFIELITAKGDIPDEVFTVIFDIIDPVEKTRYLEALKNKAREVKRLGEVNKLIKAWQTKLSQEQRQEHSNKTEFTDAPIVLNCGRYVAKDMGIKYWSFSSSEPKEVEVCPHPILPVERYINIDTELEKVKLSFFKDFQWKSVVCECNTIYNKNYICALADRGVMVTSENSKALVKYLADVVSLNMREIPLYKSISRLGWTGEKDFAPYSELKYDGDECYRHIYRHVCTKGDYGVWGKHMYEVRKHKEVRMMMAASFASPLIEKVGALPFVLHLWGITGGGKTVALMTAVSIWGDPENGCLTRTMNMTQNSMARTAAFLYSIPFAADELQQIKSRWDSYDSLIMYLTEGIDRGRARAGGGIEEIKTWKNCFLFTGEEPITKNESGGGVKNRVIEVEISDKIIEDGNLTAAIVRENYGFAGKTFVKYIAGYGSEKLRNDYKTIFKDILQKTDTTEKQAMSMALMLLADKLACECVFKKDTPLCVGDVKEYLTSVSSVDVGVRAYDWAVNWIAANQSKFCKDNEIFDQGDVWGKICYEHVMINKNIISAELNKVGFDYTAVTKQWAKRGFIVKTNQGKYVHHAKILGIKAYYIKLMIDKGSFVEIDDIDDIPF